MWRAWWGVDMVMVVVVMRRKCDMASLACAVDFLFGKVSVVGEVRSIVLCNNFYLRKCEMGGELGQFRHPR
jgi:hypothetical protein